VESRGGFFTGGFPFCPVRAPGDHGEGVVYAELMPTNSSSGNAALEAQVKYELLSVLSHELNTPMQLVLQHQEALEDLLAGESHAAALDSALEGMRQGYDQLNASLRDILDAARLSGGRCPLRLAPVCLQTLVLDVMTLMQPRFEERGVGLEVQWSPYPAVVMADEDRVAEVLSRVLEDVLRQSPAAGAVVVRNIWLPGFCGLAIEDPASGLVAGDYARLFEAFTQRDASARRPHAGLGLGLFICRGIIAAHAGRIGARARAGGGNVFWFALPTGDR